MRCTKIDGRGTRRQRSRTWFSAAAAKGAPRTEMHCCCNELDTWKMQKVSNLKIDHPAMSRHNAACCTLFIFIYLIERGRH
jgi:hypothetical protein